ncbi:hypothetical protein GE107_22320 [Cohnella sp. CFH 77786]|uniref:hypothetical protein n=1 Tax=Cohnella sp. CFH 77786 TaxID=2662265 RepID=UPI001C60B307|nr:hypothetical protein [Cohnella sp. CFH 77786]MBW5448781.1 hypothetical protein [Cohnella sp. CFH 77786]
MKKKLAVLTMCMMLIGAGSAFAETPAQGTAADPTAAQIAAPVKKLQLMKEFQDELHAVNDLRAVRLETKAEIVRKQDRLLDLTLAAKEQGKKEGLKQAAQIRKQIHALGQETGGLYDSMHAEIKAFREAVKNRDSDQAQTHIDNAIRIFGQINAKLKEKSGLYDQIIAILD